MLLLFHILRDGVILSLAASAWLLLILLINPRIMLQDYPQEIQDRVPPKSTREKRLSYVLGIPFLLLLIGGPFASTLLLKLYSADAVPFLRLFANAFGVAFVFNLVDWLLIDWLIFCTITPRFLVITGTESAPAYRDYDYHTRGFAKGTVFCLLVGLASAGILSLL